MTRIELYQSVLRKLSAIPQLYLEDVDKYLSNLLHQPKKTASNQVTAIMAFAGSWSDMNEDDFSGYWEETKNVRANLFNRNIKI